MRRLSFRHWTRGDVARLLLALVFLLPLFWMLTASFYPRGEALPTTLRLLPAGSTGENYVRIFDILPLTRYTLNSGLVALLAVPITVVTGSWAGLGMARLPRKSQRHWVVISLAVLMVPGIALWTTRFFIYRQLGLLDTIWALILPAFMGSSPFYVLMFYRAFRRIPASIYEAAALDGAGVLQTWWQVALPIARPTAIGVALLSLVLYWGDFISPLLYLQSERLYTLPIALQSLQQLSRSDWGLLMAAAVWATLVPVVIFVLAQPLLSGESQPRALRSRRK